MAFASDVSSMRGIDSSSRASRGDTAVLTISRGNSLLMGGRPVNGRASRASAKLNSLFQDSECGAAKTIVGYIKKVIRLKLEVFGLAVQDFCESNWNLTARSVRT